MYAIRSYYALVVLGSPGFIAVMSYAAFQPSPSCRVPESYGSIPDLPGGIPEQPSRMAGSGLPAQLGHSKNQHVGLKRTYCVEKLPVDIAT